MDEVERVVVVTGANRGIGREVARQLAARGETVVLTARDADAARRAGHAVGATAHQLDVTDERSVERLASDLARQYGRVDALVNNAAIHYDTWQRAVDADLGVVHEAFETNLFGAWRTASALVPLLRRGRQRRIVNVSSESGSLAVMGSTAPRRRP